ncbi:hypothetical protein WJM97_06120 [Okeanomitos corallinicola TIOX110]|uniref:Uncharacterized protein n=1 Tax=Okeanomitos corallinicola TIOX110 TaxID=3133117 RepID=A0ABZ2UWG8_9CYAN
MQMRTTTANTHSKPSTPRYSPSVPVYVYRELVAELQAVQARLDAVTGQNHQLSQENQQLRQEFNSVVESCLELQKRLESSKPGSQSHPRNQNKVQNIPSYQPMPRVNTEVKNPHPTSPSPASPSVNRTNPVNKPTNKPTGKSAPPPRKPTSKPPQKSKREPVSVPMMDMNFPSSETVYIEEQGVGYYISTESDTKGLSGWWLLLTIVLIMITGFSAGYLVIRPLLQSQSK